MALFLDIHQHVPGLTAEAVAHAQDLQARAQHGVKYVKYRFDDGTRNVFCLLRALKMEGAEAVHREARGLPAPDCRRPDNWNPKLSGETNATLSG